MKTEQGNTDSGSLVPSEIIAMRDQYRRRHETSLLDAAAAATALNAIQTVDAVDPQMLEAFQLAVPGRDLDDYLDALDFDNPASVRGAMSNWRGKYFEVMVRDSLNSGEQVGDLVLAEGQTAVLAGTLNQPGWDLQIVSEAGDPVTELQLKAVQEIGQIEKVLETYPDFEVVATLEAAEKITDPMVMSSDISNDELKSEMVGAVDAVVDSPLVDALELFGQGLPVVLIVGTEGTMWIMGRRTFATALSNSVTRTTRTGIAMAAGAIVATAGAAVFSIPTVFATHLAFTRHSAFSKLDDQIDLDIQRLRMMKSATVSN